MAKQIFRLVRQNGTSDKYGPCELCGEFVSDMFSQTQMIIDDMGHEYYGGNAFGHKECLIALRKRA